MTEDPIGSYENIAVTRRESVTQLRLHTGGGPFIMSARAHSELGEVFTEAARDQTTKVVIITGTGDTFCVLRDIPPRPDGQPESYPSFHETWVEGTRLLNALVPRRDRIIRRYSSSV
jgi:enoyl-CoA hydratase/carnithine racemase